MKNVHAGALATYVDIVSPAAFYSFDQRSAVGVKLELDFLSRVEIE